VFAGTIERKLLEISVVLVVIGVAAGILGSLVGIGGGIIMSPTLAFLGLPPAQLASTSLIAVSSTSTSSVIAYARLQKIKYDIAIKMAIFSSPGAIFGALISTNIAPLDFKLLFTTGIYVIYRSSILSERKVKTDSGWIKIFFYSGTVAAGIISSLFGIGGGVIFVPLLVLINGMNMSSAVPTAQLALMSTSLVGTFAHVILGNPEYAYALFLCTGSFVGAQIGSKLLARFNDSTLAKIFAFLLIVVAIRFVLDLYSK
jgi:uncharacterized membrane protein YfcA